MKKIVIVGCAGTGKSTLARQLGDALNVKVVHLDALYWKPEWITTPEHEWRETVAALVAGDSWILDGNFSSTRTLRFAAADTIIFLDFWRPLCFLRVIKRRFDPAAQSRPDRAAGCPEQLNGYLYRHIWTFPQRIRPALLADLETYAPGRRIIHLRRPGEVHRLLHEVKIL